MSGQYPGSLHSLARQQSGMNDAQLVQQQIMLKQMQELQRHQQMQQLEAMQRNPMAPVPPFSNQGGGNYAPTFINGTPMHDPSSYPWLSQVMTGNRNLVQQGASPSGQGHSNELMISPEQGNQAPRFMGLVPQQASQSLYGFPVSSTRSGGVPSQVGMAMMHQMPVQGYSSLSPNEHPSFSEKRNLKEASILSRRGFEGNISFEHASRQGSDEVANAKTYNQMQQQLPPRMNRNDTTVSLAPSFPDQTTKPVASSQETVGLDPAEEKILFGGDDNIWEAFGGSLTESAGCQNQSKGGFPSTQSGSWSALMQSAVAEAFSSDEGKQREWRGVGLQNSGSLAGNQQVPMYPDSGKQSTSRIDSSQMASVTSRPLANDACLSSNYRDSGLQQPYIRQSKETQEARSGHQSSEESKKWLESSQPKMVTQGHMAHDSSYPPGDYSSRSSSSSRSYQRTMFSHGDQPSRPGDPAQSETYHGGKVFKHQENLNNSYPDKVRNVNLVSGGGMAMLGSLPNSGLELGSHQMNPLELSSNISFHQVSENAHHEFGRPGNPAFRPGTDDSLKYQQHLHMTMPHVSESTVNFFDQCSGEMHERKISNHRENSSDSYGSNISNHTSSGGLRENALPDASDTHGWAGSKQSLSAQANRTTTQASRKFQYHHMGEVDADMNHSYGAKNLVPSNTMSGNLYGLIKSQEGQSKFVNPMTSNSAEVEKSSVQNLRNDIYGVSSGGNSPGFRPTSSFGDRSGGNTTPCNSGTSSSQNMLDLLQKDDYSKEQQTVSCFSSTDFYRSSNASKATSAEDATSGAKQSSSSTFQGFGLQLAPPSQGLQATHLMMLSQNPSQTVNSPNSRYVVSDKGDKVHVWPSSGVCSQRFPSAYQSSQGEAKFNNSSMTGQKNADFLLHNVMQMNITSSYAAGSLDKRSILQNQKITGSSSNNSQNVSASQEVLCQPSTSDQSDVKASVQQMAKMNSTAPYQASPTHGMYHKGDLSSMIPNLWTGMMNQRQSSSAQSFISSNMLKNRSHANDIQGTSTSNFHQIQIDKDVDKKVDVVNLHGYVGSQKQMLHGRQPDLIQAATMDFKAKKASAPNLSDVPRPDFGIAQKDIETFDRKPNVGISDGYSFRQQTQILKDPNKPQAKRFKREEDGFDDQPSLGKLHHPFPKMSNSVDGNLSTNCAPGDAKILSFSPEQSNERAKHFQPLGTLYTPVQDGLQRFSGNSRNPQISLQMAPTWFKQFGTLQNGQLLSHYDGQRAQAVSNMSQQFITDKNSKDISIDHLTLRQQDIVNSGQMGSTQQLHSLHSLASGYASRNVDSLGLKKRKSTTAGLLPWHKEVASVPQQRLPSISLAEHEWAWTAHRLFEKVEDEVKVDEGLTPVSRARRRLMFTSQLMQQIFRPPPREILSLDACTNCETVTFFVARIALGDTCSLICQSDGNSSVSHDGGNQSGVLGSHDRISYQYLGKVIEDFISRAITLENEFSRLDRRALFLDLRLESEELERFSVINRFARFHGQNQAGRTTEASSTSGQAQTVGPVKYVNAYGEPKYLPERVQCFSL